MKILPLERKHFIILTIMLIFGVLFHTCEPAKAQYPQKCNYETNYRSFNKNDNAINLIIMSASQVMTEAIGNTMFDNGNKELGHLCQLTSFGIALSTPYVVDIRRDNWHWHLLTYMAIRFALFDYTYNIAAGLPYNYIGNTSYWDKFQSKLNTNNGFLLPKIGALTIGISIPLKHY